MHDLIYAKFEKSMYFDVEYPVLPLSRKPSRYRCKCTKIDCTPWKSHQAPELLCEISENEIELTDDTMSCDDYQSFVETNLVDSIEDNLDDTLPYSEEVSSSICT